jgi:hypothetical protein
MGHRCGTTGAKANSTTTNSRSNTGNKVRRKKRMTMAPAALR